MPPFFSLHTKIGYRRQFRPKLSSSSQNCRFAPNKPPQTFHRNPSFTSGIRFISIFRLTPVFLNRRSVIFILQNDVVRAALHNARGRYHRQLCLFLEFRNRQSTAVAHCGFHLAQRQLNIILQRSRIRNIRIDAFLKLQLAGFSVIVTGPVSRTGGAFTPISLTYVPLTFILFVGDSSKRAK